MILYILLGIFPVLGILALILSHPHRGPAASASWLQFRSQGKAAGFSFSELSRLRAMVEQSGKMNPFSLFQSTELLDYCIRSLVRTTPAGGANSPAQQNFIARLYECRKKIGARGQKQGLVSSREIEAGQNLRVVSDSAIYRSQVIKNTSEHILATRPVNPELRSAPVWQGRKI